MSYGLLLLRVVVGGTMFSHGAQNSSAGSAATGCGEPLTLATVAVALAATGPGRFSIDRLIGWDDNISGVWWGVGVAAAALAISFLTVTVLRHREAMQEQPAA